MPVRAENPAHVQQLLETNLCAGCDLSGANLSQAHLIGADLRNADLSGAILVEANLEGADLTG
ncbi:MAG: pentapeptide repeat-containing protein, partial [Leptolyngbyaceae cyanobacterium SM2_5_2]|nr:pentapeptide repeat-containing protein [Leptolyngbyaceae cyanobacterium SM2_5_2]